MNLKLTETQHAALRTVQEGKVRAEMTDRGPFHAMNVHTVMLRDLWRRRWAEGNSTDPWTLTPAGLYALRAHEAQADDTAVDAFACAMKAKLAQARAKGRSGWQTCPAGELSRMLREHVKKGDPRDVANFAMFLWTLGHGIEPAAQAEPVEPAPARRRVPMDPQPSPHAESMEPQNQGQSCAWIACGEHGEWCGNHTAPHVEAIASREFPEGTWHWVLPAQGKEEQP